jgi:putative transposase
VLVGALSNRLDELIRQACQVRRWSVLELSIQPDHVHLMIQVWPKESVSEVVQILKGGSSRVIRQEFPELEEFIWSSNLWSDGYFAETIGHVDEGVVRRYIRDQ